MNKITIEIWNIPTYVYIIDIYIWDYVGYTYIYMCIIKYHKLLVKWDAHPRMIAKMQELQVQLVHAVELLTARNAGREKNVALK